MVLRLEDLVHRIDNELHEHFENEGLQYIQFGFRWMNQLSKTAVFKSFANPIARA